MVVVVENMMMVMTVEGVVFWIGSGGRGLGQLRMT